MKIGSVKAEKAAFTDVFLSMRLLLVIQLIEGAALAPPIASIGEADDTFGPGLTGFF